ncbi:MAG: peptide ABC transporter substrate-binding protein [Clostridia bacterium]|nr:peptide ABC transporter substrate-binding protein [Clostridia bacterium]
MKFSKTLLLVFLIAVLACALVACAPQGNGPDAESSAPDWAAYDALIAQIKAETDFVAREALMHQAEDMLMATGAVMPLYYYNDIYMMKPGIEGFYNTVNQTKYFMYATYGDATTLRINLASEPARLDPHLNSSVDGAALAANSFIGLYKLGADSVPIPDAATGYEMSEDGLVWTFTLRDGLKFSDGSDLTADDVVYSWKRAADPETAADYSYMYSGIAGFDDGDIQVANVDGKFQVTLNAPCAYFLDLCAFPTYYIIKQDAVETAEGYQDANGNLIDAGAWATEAGYVTSGAYTLETWNHNESMVYVKNPYYWDAANVKLERLEFMLSADEPAIFAAYQAGDLDFIDTVPTDEIASVIDNPEFYIDDVLGTYYVCFNVKSDLFAGKTVEQAAAMRQAFSYLVDRQYIIDTVGQTGQKIATSFIPDGMLDGHGGVFNDSDDAYTFPAENGYFDPAVNVDTARELLESAGYTFDENGMLSADTPISFEYLTNQTTGHVAIAECIQQDLAALGISMSIKTVDWDVFLNERKAGNYDIARNGWIADFNDPINMLEMWITDSGNNDIQFGR